MFKKSSSAHVSPKIPMIAGLLLLLAGVVGGVYLIQNRQSPTETQADVGTAPSSVEVSNVTSNSFTISWVTQNPTSGFLTYGTSSEKINSVARDKRDLLSSDYLKYSTHYVQVSGLNPATEYFFMVNSGKTAYLTNESVPYTVKTASNLAEGSLSAISGKVQTSDGGVLENAIVLISGPNLSTQSVLTDATGDWSMSLGGAVDPSLSKEASISQNDDVTIRVQSNLGNSTALILGQQINDIPTISAGETFDFRSLVASSTQRPSSFTFIDDLSAQSPTASQTINIFNPQENEALSTTKPLFMGTAPAGNEISISVIQKQTQLTGVVMSDERGNWRWTSEEDLALGSHVVRASYTNDSGITFQAEKRFSILGNVSTNPAIESSPGGELAQVSPGPTIIAQVSLTPTQGVRVSPTVSVSKTPAPTRVLSPTPTVTTKLTPTVTLVPTRITTLVPTVSVTSEVTLTASPTPTMATELPVAATTLPTYITGIVISLFLGVAVLLLI